MHENPYAAPQSEAYAASEMRSGNRRAAATVVFSVLGSFVLLGSVSQMVELLVESYPAWNRNAEPLFGAFIIGAFGMSLLVHGIFRRRGTMACVLFTFATVLVSALLLGL